MVCGIYKIVNKDNGKIYIGSSNSIFRRFSEHKRKLKRNKHYNAHLQNSWNKGCDRFSFILVCICKKSELRTLEQQYIDCFTPEYNISKNTEYPVLSKKKRKNMGKSLRKYHDEKGRKYVAISPEGEIFYFRNMNRFAEDHGMCSVSIGQVKNNPDRYKTHKGWRFYNESEFTLEKVSEKIIRSTQRKYVGISPQGVKHFFSNARNFCKENNLKSHGMISSCCLGKSKQYLGWRFYYLQDYEQGADKTSPC